MALEQAGVDLQAKGFQEYIKNLTTVEKQQREVFDQQFKGTELSYRRIVSEAKKYEKSIADIEKQQNRILAKAIGQKEKEAFRQATQAAREHERQLKAVTREQEKQARLTERQARQPSIGIGGALGGIALGLFSQQTAQAVIESAKAAVAFEGQKNALDNLASAYGTSSIDIRSAIRDAAQGTLSETAIILAANQALQLDVARTADDFGRVTTAALVLGKTFGISATEAIERFTTALGRKSLQRLDDFGIKAEQVNKQIAILGQEKFGKPFEKLLPEEKDLLFVEAALRVADERVKIIGTDIIGAKGSTDQLVASMENLKVAFGEAVLPSVSEMGGLLADVVVTAQQLVTVLGAGGAAIGAFFEQLGGSLNILENIREKGLEAFRPDILLTGIDFTELFQGGSIERAADAAGEAFNERFKAIARTQGISFPEDAVESSTQAIKENTEAVKANEEQIEAIQGALQQAEQLELSFARAAEDAARKLERQQAKLGRTQGKEREKLLIKQQKDLDKFEKERVKTLEENEQNRIKSIAKAEADIAKAEQEANRQRIDAQKQLQQRLAQQAEQFRLSQTQSERRFQLDERRLRAEGDILGLQQLRENHSVEQLEAQENFDLQQKQTKEGEQAQSETRVQEQQARLEELKANLDQERKDLEISLEEQRAALLAGFDEQLLEQETAQAEARASLLENFAEQEEDRRINQARQLEDLGRNLAEQKDLTAAGALAVAEELEKVFGIEGVADTVMGGFTDRTESKFNDLFGNISKIVEESTKEIERIPAPKTPTARAATELLGLPSFQEGGIVPGPIGSPQIIRAEGGETVLPTHRMSVPIIPSQSLNVLISGGFDISGGEMAGQAVVQAAVKETVDTLKIALERLTRKQH